MTDAPTTSDRILDTALGLIVTGGYNGFSYADIAEAVGIRKASIHHHFPGKADLVEALLVRYRQGIDDAIARLEQGSPDARHLLQHYIGYWQGCIADGSRPFCLCALLACEIEVLPEKVAAQVRGHFQSLTGAVARAIKRGSADGTLAPSDPPEVEAEMFVATLHGAMLSARASGDPAVFTTITSHLLSRLFA